MYFHFLLQLITSILAQRSYALCTGDLLIDDFEGWLTRTNSLNSWVSDDGTMTSISAAQGWLSFVPKTASYFCETLPCNSYYTDGYNTIQFAIDAPAGSGFDLETQTVSTCAETRYTSEEVVFTGLMGGIQLLSVPLLAYSHSNLNAITSFVWGTFSNTTAVWRLSGINFACDATVSSLVSASFSTAKPSSSAPSV